MLSLRSRDWLTPRVLVHGAPRFRLSLRLPLLRPSRRPTSDMSGCFQEAKPAGSCPLDGRVGAAPLAPRLERYTCMALHPKNDMLIEAGFVFGRKCTNRGFAAVVVRMHEAKDERPFVNHIAILIGPLARCLPDSEASRKARRHRRGKKRRPLFECDDAVRLRGTEVQQVSDRTLLARHAPGLAH